MKASDTPASPARRRVPASVDAAVARRVQRAAPGSVFTPALFARAGSRGAVDKALQRLTERGALRRLARGLYDKPRTDALLGTLWPSVDEVVNHELEVRMVSTRSGSLAPSPVTQVRWRT